MGFAVSTPHDAHSFVVPVGSTRTTGSSGTHRSLLLKKFGVSRESSELEVDVDSGFRECASLFNGRIVV